MVMLTKKAIRKEGYLNGPGLVVAGEIIEPRDAEAAYADHGREMPSPPPSKQGKLTTELSSKSDVTHQETLRGEDTLNGTSLAVAGEIFGRRDVEAAYADHSSGETRSPQPSKQEEPAADLSSKSDDHRHQDIRRGGGLPNGPSLAVADEIFGRRDVGAAYADHSIGEMRSPPPSEQGEPAAEVILRRENSLNSFRPAAAGEVFGQRGAEGTYTDYSIGETPSPPPSEKDEPAAKDILRGVGSLNGPSPAVGGEIFGQHDVEDAYAVHSIGEILSPPPSEQGEAAAVAISPGEQSAPDPIKAFFSVDVEHAVEMVRRKLGREGYRNDPGLVEAGELPDPTKAFFSVDVERAVGIVRREFGREDYIHDPELVAAGELPEPTKDFFSVDVERAVEMVRKALEKGAPERAGPGS
jgi:hypothetical protein